MLHIIGGHDPNDSTSSREPVPNFFSLIGRGLKGTRLGIIKQLSSGLSAAVSASFQGALTMLQDLGAAVEEVSIPSIEQAPALATTIMFAEAAEFHENWLRTRPQDYGFDVRRTLEAGLLTPAMYYVRAQRARAVVMAEALAALEDRIALIAPTAAIAAPPIRAFRHQESALSRRADALVGEHASVTSNEQVNMVSAVLRFTAPFNITGQPALAIPTGLSPEGLPMSMQIIGRPFDETSVFQVAAAYEEARGPLPNARGLIN